MSTSFKNSEPRVALSWIALLRVMVGLVFLSTWAFNLADGFYTPDGLLSYPSNPRDICAVSIGRRISAGVGFVSWFPHPTIQPGRNFLPAQHDAGHIRSRLAVGLSDANGHPGSDLPDPGWSCIGGGCLSA
jgi:hypothetical protein